MEASVRAEQIDKWLRAANFDFERIKDLEYIFKRRQHISRNMEMGGVALEEFNYLNEQIKKYLSL